MFAHWPNSFTLAKKNEISFSAKWVHSTLKKAASMQKFLFFSYFFWLFTCYLSFSIERFDKRGGAARCCLSAKYGLFSSLTYHQMYLTGPFLLTDLEKELETRQFAMADCDYWVRLSWCNGWCSNVSCSNWKLNNVLLLHFIDSIVYRITIL